MQDFEGRTAVVTGGASGIGQGIATACAERSMNVVVADIEQSAAEEAAAALRDEHGVRALAVRTDVSDRASVEALADAAYGEFGSVQLLVNNAGVLVMSPFEEATPDDLQWMLGVNLFGLLHGVQVFLPRMLAQEGERHIVNTSSMSGLAAGAGLSGYVASKFAAVGLTEAIQRDLKDQDVTVSLFCPGATETRITEAERNRPAEFGPAHSGGPESLTDLPARAAPGRRQPLDVGRAVLEGVEADRYYIFTHPERRGLVEARHKWILAGFDQGS